MRLQTQRHDATLGGAGARLADTGIAGARFSAALFAGALFAVALLAAGCGRSAPEGAFTELAPEEEPAAAGVQFASADPVIAPVATTPTTVAPAPAMEAGTYQIQPGDTLSVIAEQFGITTTALSEANNITDPDSIRPGQELIIPAPAG